MSKSKFPTKGKFPANGWVYQVAYDKSDVCRRYLWYKHEKSARKILAKYRILGLPCRFIHFVGNNTAHHIERYNGF